MGRFDESLVQSLRAVALDPLNSRCYADLGRIYATMKRFPEAEAAYRSALELSPDGVPYRFLLSVVIAAQGRNNEGLAEIARERAEWARLFGSSTTLPVNESGSVGVALLNRAYPNPFSGSTNFAYKVAEGGASVDVGVYNVAGRLVKTLAAGPQSAGTYTVTWNGSDASGVRMAVGHDWTRARLSRFGFVCPRPGYS